MGLESFKHLSRKFLGIEARKVRLLEGKRVYSDVYLDWWAKMDEQQLPPKEAFYWKLTDSYIRDEDSEHDQNVWRKFSLRTMRDYYNLYMMSMPHTFPIPIIFTRHDSNNTTIHIMNIP